MEVFTKQTVEDRLTSFGYTLKETDDLILMFYMEKVRDIIKNDTNQSDIPEGLERIAVDMVVGELLSAKKTFAPESLDGFDIGYAVKQLTTGDTTTVFATGESTETDEQRLNTFIDYLKNYGREQFACYRKLRW